MKGAVQQEPAYVVHRRPWRETALLVDLFTLNHGRMSVVARGANSARSPLKAQLQPFQPLLVDWTGKSDLKTLVQLEVRNASAVRHPRALYSGFYINELVQRVLPVSDPSPALFASYIETLKALANLPSQGDVEPVLRRFERAFASALGYDFAWDETTDTRVPVEAGCVYGYDPVQGIVSSSSPDVPLRHLPGEALLALGEGNYSGDAPRKTAKRVMRVLVDYLMQGKPLHSRTLFSHSNPLSGRTP
ncbi:DNA repair protein RecO [Marinobacter daepoensis]|uniref:DNA repair protein RecO n=1 Tax=Marinobacter daepoensis TaxID=262077 RepID=A0ABS3BID3_9GAMM|nr:DNA repair protein RecO [Marinobacter daepoensis]MBN7771419.1 DNA repair protein RecO [Marinobacter daepoensis]MBY6034310.1 DNA repair protein RecO [Marinobacter daepoensis]MBY6080020.1 DNA repair protein RecO [Marinobacter daepoensis]